MKKTLTILALLFAVLAVRAGQIPLAMAFNTQNDTMSSGASYTNAAWTNFCEKCTYHTWHIVNAATNTNSFTMTVVLKRGLTATNLFPFATNTLTSASVAEVTATGKWSYYAVSLTGTNTSVTINYLGQ